MDVYRPIKWMCLINIHLSCCIPADGQTMNQLRNMANTEIQPLNDIPVQRGRGTYNLRTPHGVNKVTPSWSQYGQDIFVDKLLNRKHNRFFVEIGGFDGETFSNSLFFEKRALVIWIIS